jgi:predicted transcriptional regulator
LSNYLKVSKYSIQKSLQKLLNLGLIKHAGTKKGKRGRPKNVYEIVDIWELNVNYYDNHKNQLKFKNLNEKSENLRKTILKKKNKNHHHPEKMMTMLTN